MQKQGGSLGKSRNVALQAGGESGLNQRLSCSSSSTENSVTGSWLGCNTLTDPGNYPGTGNTGGRKHRRSQSHGNIILQGWRPPGNRACGHRKAILHAQLGLAALLHHPPAVARSHMRHYVASGYGSCLIRIKATEPEYRYFVYVYRELAKCLSGR